ncbi:MAG: hypothetical protein GXP58_09945 [Deltaproteobacteria bacterium]|nr:hypothetical protein [Deltaproteobacteria bacterium]
MKHTLMIVGTLCAVFFILAVPVMAPASGAERILFHIKTDLAKDDAQICVAYNMIREALREGKEVSVLIDASAVNTYKRGWLGHDALEGYKLPENLRAEIARQTGVGIGKVPATYGAYLTLLHDEGARFYINGGMLVVAGISEKFGDLSKLSVDFFKPVTFKEMLHLFGEADRVVVY